MATFQGFVRKTSPEYLGYLYAGEWVEFGIGTMNQPLKEPLENLGLKQDSAFDKFGPFLVGDFSRTHLRTKFENSSTVGIASQLNGGETAFSGQIPSFVLGDPARLKEIDLAEAIAVITNKMQEMQVEYTPVEKDLLKEVYQKTSFERKHH